MFFGLVLGVYLAIPFLIGFAFPKVNPKWIGWVFAGLKLASSIVNQLAMSSLSKITGQGMAPADDVLIGTVIGVAVVGFASFGLAKLGVSLRMRQDRNRYGSLVETTVEDLAKTTPRMKTAVTEEAAKEPANKYVPDIYKNVPGIGGGALSSELEHGRTAHKRDRGPKSEERNLIWSILGIVGTIAVVALFVLGSVGARYARNMSFSIDRPDRFKYEEINNNQFGQWHTAWRRYNSGETTCELRLQRNNATVVDVSFYMSGGARVVLNALDAGSFQGGTMFVTVDGTHYQADETNTYRKSASGVFSTHNAKAIINKINQNGIIWLMNGKTVIQRTDLPTGYGDTWKAKRAVEECRDAFSKV